MASASRVNAATSHRDQYCFRLALTDPNGAAVHEHPLGLPAFERAIREAAFAGYRAGVFDSFVPRFDAASVEPRFTNTDQQTRSQGFRIRLPASGGQAFACDFPVAYFNALAATVRAGLQRDGKVSAEQSLYFALDAYLEQTPLEPATAMRLEIDPPANCVSIRSHARSTLGQLEPWDSPDQGQLPVYVARSVIDDGCDEARRNPDREIGGLLLGQPCRDPLSSEVFLLVTCLVLAQGTAESTKTSITFTPDSFARARAMAQLRSRPGVPAEIIVGWFHSHPFRFCAECPLPTPPECVQKVLFFSSDDIQLMESTFDQPFMVGLLAAVEPRLEAALGHAPARLYGWNQGQISARGFHVMDL